MKTLTVNEVSEVNGGIIVSGAVVCTVLLIEFAIIWACA